MLLDARENASCSLDGAGIPHWTARVPVSLLLPQAIRLFLNSEIESLQQGT